MYYKIESTLDCNSRFFRFLSLQINFDNKIWNFFAMMQIYRTRTIKKTTTLIN